MTREDIKNIINIVCPNDEDFEKPIISTAYLKQELEALALEQEPKTGHWIEHEHNGILHIECSECLSWFLRAHLLRNSYCPNCGAKMKK